MSLTKVSYSMINGSYLNVLDFGATGDGVTDDTAAIQLAIDAAIAQGKAVFVPNGTYFLSTANNSIVLPYDDGTAYPGWLSSGDVNIAAETQNTMDFALYASEGVSIVGESVDGVIFKNTWNPASSDVNLSQKGCLAIGNNFGGYVSGNSFCLQNINFENWFMPVLWKGILTQSFFQNINFSSCGFTLVGQGLEGNSTFQNIGIYNSYCGLLSGGWWLMRDRTSYETTYMPPYPAPDAFRTGWTDNTIIDNIEFSQVPAVSRAADFDTFYDTYFFKSANSSIYPTGRATVNSAPDFLGFATYRGASGSGVRIYCRYQRQAQRVTVNNYVGSGNFRSAIYVTKGFVARVAGMYVERALRANPAGTAYSDPYYSSSPNPADCVWIESVAGSTTNTVENIYQSQPLPNTKATSGPTVVANGNRFDDGINPNFYLGNTVESQDVNVVYGNYQTINNMVFFSFDIFVAAWTKSGVGDAKITGLPETANEAAGGTVNVNYISRVNTGVNVTGVVSGSTLFLYKDTALTPLTNADFGSGAGDLVIRVSGYYFA